MKRAYPFDNEGGDFNHKAARAMYDLVAKMDEDSAVMFTEILISDVLEETIEKNLPAFQKRLNTVIAKRRQSLEKALLSTVSKDNSDAAKAYARALSEIRKFDWDEKLHPRDKSGRFSAKITHNQTRPLPKHKAAMTGVSGMDAKYDELSHRQKAQYQDEYRQISSFLQHAQQATGGNMQVNYQVRDKAGNRFVHNSADGLPPSRVLTNPDFTVEAVEARPTALTYGGAAFGLTNELGQKAVNAGEGQFSSFASDWTSAGDDYNSNKKIYDRVNAGSQMLTAVGSATANPKLLAAGKAGEFVGRHGAEAEAVIGPSARKTAYRYRGTEKTPDARMVSEYAQAIKAAKSRSDAEANAGRQLAPVQEAAQRISRERRTPSQEEIRAASQTIVRSLRRTMPSRNLYNLQLASGNTPPSEGVMLNRDGQIVAQAVGYGDDHYLPFNLKNLKSLKGGEYIRTRSVGGPTSEDIYTGLVSGARRLTVVSRSGTFTVTFEDDFRGGRRHNDKARRMTRRYEQILDAVQSEQIDHEDIPSDVRTQIINDVAGEAQDMGWDRPTQVQMVRNKINEYKSNPDLTPDERDVLDRKITAANANARNDEERQQNRAEIIGAAMAAKEFKYKLNGPGYQAALKALEEQFPYYIKTDARPLHDLEGYSPARDKGYVEPGRNRPTQAKAGLYGTQTNPGRKFSASHADYQGYKLNRKAEADRPAEAKPEAKAEETKQAEPETVKRNVEMRNAAAEMQDELRAMRERGDFSGEFKLSSDEEALLDAKPNEMADPDKQRRLSQLVDDVISHQGQVSPDKLRRFRAASGHLERREYDPEVMIFGSKPNTFGNEGAYAPGASVTARGAEISARDGHSVRGDKKFSQMSEQELESEFNTLAKLHTEFRASKDQPLDEGMLKNAGGVKGSPGLSGLNGAAAVQQRMENLQRVRTLKSDMPDQGEMVVHSSEQSGAERAGSLREQKERVQEQVDAAIEHYSTVNPARAEHLNDFAADFNARHFDSVDDMNSYLEQNKDSMGMTLEALYQAKTQRS